MQREVNIYVKRFCETVFRLMLFLAVFDGIRSRTPIADLVTIFKEISTFTLLAIILLTYKSAIHKKVLYYSNFFLLVYLVLLGTVVIYYNDVSRTLIPALNRLELASPFAMHFKNIESLIIVFVLLHYTQLTGYSISRLLVFFVHLCIAYVLFTLVVYFLFESTTFFQTPWYGRISIGYPTSDAQILSFGLIFLIFGKSDLPASLKGIYIIILIGGVLMNATATGILSIGIILLCYIIHYILSGKIISIFSTKSLVYIGIGIIVFFVGKQLAENLAEKVNNYSSLLETKMGFVTGKLNQTFGDEKLTTDYDIDISEGNRKNQIEKAFMFNKDAASLILGGPISLGTFIENENYFIIRSYGIVGLLLYYQWLILLGIAALRKIKKSYAQLMMVAITILVVTNSAIITTYLYGIAVSFGLFVSYFYNRLHQENLEA